MGTCCKEHLAQMVLEESKYAEDDEVIVKPSNNPKCDYCDKPAELVSRYHLKGSGIIA